MNPSYKLQIDVTLVKLVTAQNIQLRRIGYLPFVPRSGDTLRLTNEDETDTVDLTLDGVVYDQANGLFIAELEDQTLVEEYKEAGNYANEKETVQAYTTYGFVRLNYPIAQCIRTDT